MVDQRRAVAPMLAELGRYAQAVARSRRQGGEEFPETGFALTIRRRGIPKADAERQRLLQELRSLRFGRDAALSRAPFTPDADQAKAELGRFFDGDVQDSNAITRYRAKRPAAMKASDASQFTRNHPAATLSASPTSGSQAKATTAEP